MKAANRKPQRPIPPGYLIRPYETGDAEALASVEARAARLFAEHGYPALAEESARSAAAFHRFAVENTTLVAVHDAGDPVGFAVSGMIGSYLHLKELSVDPAHGRRGVGTRLLHAVIAMSLKNDAVGVSLTTFRSVPFNAPFYRRHGFKECSLDGAPAALKQRFAAEVPPGIDPASRVLLLRNNGFSTGPEA